MAYGTRVNDATIGSLCVKWTSIFNETCCLQANPVAENNVIEWAKSQFAIDF